MRYIFLSVWFATTAIWVSADAVPLKKQSAFFTTNRLETIRANLEKHPDRDRILAKARENAAFWRALSDEELWGLMFGATLPRSWMVWSNGHCPACKKSVPMYEWKIEPKEHRWKVRCPQCEAFFPKNDFGAFYRSGLDDHGVFNPQRADRSLLFNSEHPDPADPLHLFGVDDGQGYVEGENRWRFIGAYLVYGQFKRLVRDGIQNLAAAYVFTGDPAYARKAAILLDRVADVYPDFDFGKQGEVYEAGGSRGYVSVWHDACEETREMVLAYDQIFEAIRADAQLVHFLSTQARKHKLENPKATFADIQRNIEGRILRDALANRPKIESNFPRTDVTLVLIHAVLGWPDNRKDVEALVDAFVKRATAVDGVTGEKGLSGYSSYTIAGMAYCLAEFDRADPQFLRGLLERVPTLRQTYRFHIDTACLDAFFYPGSGDAGSSGMPLRHYRGLSMLKATSASLLPSMYTFLWRLYEETGDVAYVQILYRENGNTLDGLPHDLIAENPEKIRQGVAEIISREGTDPKLRSVNKEQWRIAILRSGQGKNARALWLDYDSGGAHAHWDGMTLGLFAHGLDLLPDFGYPPVQYGGWTSPKARWYLATAAHNTVTVDGKNQSGGGGATTLWGDGEQFHAIRASAPLLIQGEQYERTACLVDVSDSEFYVVDIFRVKGGSDHAKFVHGPPGALVTDGLKLQPAEDYGHGTFTRNFRRDSKPAPGWSATWRVNDWRNLLPADTTVNLRHTDLSEGIEAHTAEAWSVPGYYTSDKKEQWNPSLVLRRQGDAPLKSTFASILEPFALNPSVARANRVSISRPNQSAAATQPSDIAIELQINDARRDWIVSLDVEASPLKPEALYDLNMGFLKSNAELLWARQKASGEIERLALCRGNKVVTGALSLECNATVSFLEIAFEENKARVLSGNKDAIRTLQFKGQPVPIK